MGPRTDGTLAVARVEQPELLPPETKGNTPLDLLRLAILHNADLDKLDRLIKMHREWEQEEARKDFVAAMTEFKASPPPIIRNRDGEHHRYATLDVVCKAVMESLSKVGISHRWEYKQADANWIEVSCILTHKRGHPERTTMGGPPDSTGPQGKATKNPIQAIASTRTYLERYTLLGAVGLESAYDDDGNGGSNKPVLAPEKIEEYCRQMSEVYNLQQLQQVFAKAINEAQEISDKQAMAHFIKARDAKQKELKNAPR